ncbi:uncharacterized protein [Drosophila suzukii]|uniref:Uncharacterized protein n=1 Tax=Drosophila suzukii TaxID=28584 RepID=A0ABM4TZN8_DROSZ
MVQCSKCHSWYHSECVGVDDDHSWQCDCENIIRDVVTEVVPTMPMSFHKPQESSSPTQGNGLAKLPYNPSYQASPLEHINKNTQSASTTVTTTSMAVGGISALGEKPAQTPCGLSNQTSHGPSPVKQQLIRPKEAEAIGSLLVGPDAANKIILTSGIPTPSQIAARQAIPRELPAFDGNPQAWPLFYSSFQTSTEIASYTNAENLMRLQSSLREHVLQTMLDKARKMPPPKDKLEPLIEYALCVRNIYSTMEACELVAHMSNPLLVQDLVEKLPSQLKLQWAMHPKETAVPVVKVFSEWMYTIAEAASQVSSPLYFGRSERLNYHSASEEPLRFRGKCVICDAGDHKIQTCPNFAAMNTEERCDVSRTHHLCLNCLNKHRSQCLSRKTCNINNCRERHHPVLHAEQLYRSEHPRQPTAPELESIHILAHRHADQTNFRIVSIKIDYKTQQINTFAFLDEGSSVTLIEETIFQQLGVTGVPHPLCLKWTDNTTRVEETSKTATLRVINTQNGAKFKLRDVRSVRSLNLPIQSANMEELAMKFPYLKGLPITSYANVRPTIIVGADNWNLAVPLRIREGAENAALPDSYPNALRRLKCLQRKFIKEPALKIQTQKEIDNLVQKKYARKLSATEILEENARVWYLPTFIITNPNKPNRVRLVWDAAAQSGGQSLNDFIHAGPDLLKPLVDLLISFRAGKVAIIGDIAEMFHQIRVKPEDAHVQRFLWYDQDDELHHPSVYTMEALTFGINCAPCFAHFIRDRNADRFQQQYPAVAQAVKNYHYVDDFIYSGNDNKEVIEIATQVRHIHAAGGFYIRNWASNSKTVLGKLGGESSSTEVEITTAEKVLGLYWIPETDDLTFIIKFSRLKRDIWTENASCICSSLAAVTGAKLSQSIQTNSRLSVNSHHYWTDSKTVLKWLRMDPRKFQQYVMHRVGEVLELTNVDQWHWVPSDLNPTDIATKTSSFTSMHKWFDGPEYLLQERSRWPTCTDLGAPTNIEVKQVFFVATTFRLAEAISSGSNVHIIHRKAESNSAENASDYEH